MTEQEWLQATEPRPMLEFLEGKASAHKLRLFGVECCRRAPHLFQNRIDKKALEVIERYADGVASEEEVTKIQFALMPSVGRRSSQAFIAAVPPVWGFMGSILQGTVTAITLLTYQIANRISERENEVARSRERAAQSSLLRDIFGNPFRPRRRLQPQWLSWNTGIIPKLAQAIYNKRAFDRMPIVAAALEKAGCTDQNILEHCRSGGEHVRGCWVIDLLLGKE